MKTHNLFKSWIKITISNTGCLDRLATTIQHYIYVFQIYKILLITINNRPNNYRFSYFICALHQNHPNLKIWLFSFGPSEILAVNRLWLLQILWYVLEYIRWSCCSETTWGCSSCVRCFTNNLLPLTCCDGLTMY